jgi:hypothetical protein
MSDDRPTTAIQRVDPTNLGLPTKPIDDIDLLQDCLAHAATQHCNLLAPVTQIQYIPPGYQIAIRVVAFPARFTIEDEKAKSNGTWYKVDGGKLALHRSALDQLASAAGISSVGDKCHVELVQPFHWRATHTVSMRTFEGQRRETTRNLEIDLRDGSPEAKAAGNGLNNARKFGSRLADTKCANRAIRAALGIQGAYNREDASKPFVFPVLIYTPDLSDPVIRRMQAAAELGIANAIFGPGGTEQMDNGSAPLLADPNNQIDADELERMQAGGRERETAPAGRIPAHPDEEPGWAKPQPSNTVWPPCGACGTSITESQANQTAHLAGGPFCSNHDPRGR